MSWNVPTGTFAKEWANCHLSGGGGQLCDLETPPPSNGYQLSTWGKMADYALSQLKTATGWDCAFSFKTMK